MTDTEIAGTRGRILEIARELIAERGYGSASISQIAGRLGTSKAALYYHFKSKEEILDALLSEPLRDFRELVRNAANYAPGKRAGEILGAMIDFVGGPASCLTAFQSDPSVIQEYAKCEQAREGEDQIVRALAGPRPSASKLIRARVAMAAAKQGTVAALSHGDGKLTPAVRAQILSAALRALGEEPD
ncbi:MAG: TetR/AcrR family transcriptional regulator [Candidatus Rokuibacteriota bacterium]